MTSKTGWVIVDKYNNPLLFDPTHFQVLDDEDDGSIIIPFVYDIDRFTVFKNENILEEIYTVWEDTISEMKYLAIPLIDVVGEMLAEEDEVDDSN